MGPGSLGRRLSKYTSCCRIFAGPPPQARPPSPRAAASVGAGWLAINGAPLGGTTAKIFGFFLKTGFLAFGSGLVIAPFLKVYIVDQNHWLTDRQFIDAVAIGMISPGPVVIAATFVGYVLNGLWGALAATPGMFAPSVLLTIVSAALLKRYRDNHYLQGFLRGIVAAVVGALLVTGIMIATSAIGDLLTAAIAGATLFVILKWPEKPKSAPYPSARYSALPGMSGCTPRGCEASRCGISNVHLTPQRTPSLIQARTDARPHAADPRICQRQRAADPAGEIAACRCRWVREHPAAGLPSAARAWQMAGWGSRHGDPARLSGFDRPDRLHHGPVRASPSADGGRGLDGPDRFRISAIQYLLAAAARRLQRDAQSVGERREHHPAARAVASERIRRGPQPHNARRPPQSGRSPARRARALLAGLPRFAAAWLGTTPLRAMRDMLFLYVLIGLAAGAI